VTQPPTPARALAATPVVLLLAGIALLATSLVGWSVDVEASPAERVADDGWLLLASAVAGGGAGALVAWVFTDRGAALGAAALAGMTPALVSASAFFTHAY
jgi:hypothetical protein